MKTKTLLLALTLTAACESGPTSTGNAALGVASLQISETAQLTKILAFDDRGVQIGDVELVHGLFKPAGDFIDYYGTAERDGRSLNVQFRDETFLWQDAGYGDTSLMPALPPVLANADAFLADPHVKPLLDKWKIGWDRSAAAPDVGAEDEYSVQNCYSTGDAVNSASCINTCPTPLDPAHPTTSTCNAGVTKSGNSIHRVVTNASGTFSEDLVSFCCGDTNDTLSYKACAPPNTNNCTTTSHHCTSCGDGLANSCKPCLSGVLAPSCSTYTSGTSACYWQCSNTTCVVDADCCHGYCSGGTCDMDLPIYGTGGTATASVAWEPVGRAIDGQTSTRWTSGPQTPGMWFQLDWGTRFMLKSVDLWSMFYDGSGSPGDYPRGYELWLSSDGTNYWLETTGSGSEPETQITFPVQPVRAFKVVETGSSGSWWSIHEVRAHMAMPLPLSRTGWTATASEYYVPWDQSAPKAIDGFTQVASSTRWSSGVGMYNGEWFQVDMGSAQTFNEVMLDSRASGGDYPRSYQLFVSNDGSTWTQATAGFGSSDGLTLIELHTTTARYIKIVQTGSSGNWWSIHDLEVFRNPG